MNTFERNLSNGEGSSTILGKRKTTDNEADLSTDGERKKVVKNVNGSSVTNKKGNESRSVPFRKARKQDKMRIGRAMTQFLHLIDYEIINPRLRKYSVLCPTGYVNTIVFSKTVSCSCPDFRLGFQCKHIYFVFLKVLKVSPRSKLIYQKELLAKELKLIFDNSPEVILPNKKEIEKLKAIALIKRRPIDGDCLVRREPLNNNEKLIWCQSGCGNNVHQDCFDEWKKRSVK
ncbi:hypothetical protein Glove_493g58 [Diversispora epigaea]|uniref:SWIM-type domain-containing protein n=1 Tax=Diversispora epigaea TaxID=1348612 RepID=A0A397GNW1_9GLOM|nr:hypothetical protein Glove_493g58 [Diversispora epigaea]